jgi:hypothetical protein
MAAVDDEARKGCGGANNEIILWTTGTDNNDTLFYFEWWLIFVTALHSLLRNQPPSTPPPPFRPHHQATSVHFLHKRLDRQVGVENIRPISRPPSIPPPSPAAYRLIESQPTNVPSSAFRTRKSQHQDSSAVEPRLLEALFRPVPHT